MAGVQYPYSDKQVADDVDIVDDDDHNKQEDQLKALTAARGGTWADDGGRPTPDANNPYPNGYNVNRGKYEYYNGSIWIQDETTDHKDAANGYCPLDGSTLVPYANLPAPAAHASEHEDGGGDEIDVTALSGELADLQPPKLHAGSTHFTGMSDEVTPLGIGADTPGDRDAAIGIHAGLSAVHHTKPVDYELQPATHDTSHENGGGDEIDVSGLTGVLANPQTPAVHKNTHVSGAGDQFLSTDIIEALVKRIRETGTPTDLAFGAIPDGKFLKRSGAGIIGTDVTMERILSWRCFPSVNGTIEHLGWFIQTDTAVSLVSGAPVTTGAPGYHSRWVIIVNAGVGLPFTIRITGISVGRDSGTETPADTEDISVTTNGTYQSTKYWLDAVSISIVEGAKSCSIDVWKTSYWYNQDTDVTIKSYTIEWCPSGPTWVFSIDIRKVNDDGTTVSIDNVSYSQASSPARASNGVCGGHKRGGFSTTIQPSTLKEGIYIEIDQSNIRHYLVEMSYE